ncbi:redoxin domain-containing protein [Malonomonas rubra]|uniref:redoxin domain-containing protein n=1 Tax=Malonomonas rubra TaxID=57040 RepID=UPI0026F17882|nr:redoxin domain-containing protein [Malonomonas rubra]
MELEALQEVLPEIESTGAKLIAISPMLSKYAPQQVKKLNLSYPLLSDPACKLLRQLGVLFPLPKAMIEVYKGFGIDLARFNGDDSWQLPLPGRIIVDQAGVVKNTEFTTDHTERPEPKETVALLKSL